MLWIDWWEDGRRESAQVYGNMETWGWGWGDGLGKEGGKL